MQEEETPATEITKLGKTQEEEEGVVQQSLRAPFPFFPTLFDPLVPLILFILNILHSVYVIFFPKMFTEHQKSLED